MNNCYILIQQIAKKYLFVFYTQKNKEKTMDPISFQGQIKVTTWTRMKDVTQNFKTTEAQDKLLRSVVENMTGERNDIVLPKRQATFLHSLMEKCTGKQIRNITNDKILYRGKDYAIFKDENAYLLDGVKIYLYY